MLKYDAEKRISFDIILLHYRSDIEHGLTSLSLSICLVLNGNFVKWHNDSVLISSLFENNKKYSMLLNS